MDSALFADLDVDDFAAMWAGECWCGCCFGNKQLPYFHVECCRYSTKVVKVEIVA